MTISPISKIPEHNCQGGGLAERIRERRADHRRARQRRQRRVNGIVSGIAAAIGLVTIALTSVSILGKADKKPVSVVQTGSSAIAAVARIEPGAGDAASHSDAATSDQLPVYEPRRSYHGFETWQRNAAKIPAGDGGLLAIVIDDMGLNRRMTERFSELPTVLTFAFLPYADGLPEQTRLVRDRGHELLIHLPMQPLGNKNDPGPQALDMDRSPGDLLNRLIWNLDRFDGYVGINNHMGSRYTSDFEHMATILGELDRRGLMFLDSLTSPGSMGHKIARDMDMAWSSRDVFLDNVREVDAITRQLDRAGRIAESRGYAVAIGHPYIETLEALSNYIKSPMAANLRLAPVSSTVRHGAGIAADNGWRHQLTKLDSDD